ncbi:hypothetical protein ACE7GA_26340 [Roseomonas sp. CCTCC AB2023176]|uniref:hypothetical protein n=1 Tax=Roseomonas sp. CCTCC AB2023176 TaxID=3342640 RepID=UPI0035D810A3
MKRPHIAGALAEPRLRPGPKRVIIDTTFDADGNRRLPLGTGYTPSRRTLADLNDLIDIIETDCDPEKLARYYRASTRGDDLLRSQLRVMHLHLRHPGSDDIVYLMQRDDDTVIILAISDHRHLEETPRGASLRLDRAKAVAATAPYTPPPPPPRNPDDEDD